MGKTFVEYTPEKYGLLWSTRQKSPDFYNHRKEEIEIPAYNSYKVASEKAALESTMNTIYKAVLLLQATGVTVDENEIDTRVDKLVFGEIYYASKTDDSSVWCVSYKKGSSNLDTADKGDACVNQTGEVIGDTSCTTGTGLCT